MTKTDKALAKMRQSPTSIRFEELERVCVEFFGDPRQSGTSHQVYATPWRGDPRVNIQNKGGMAKAYQVRQVLDAIDKLKTMQDEDDSKEEEK
ncbi:toxin HicA [Isoptericola sp. NEAU-Y5]|uniref:Toxin HicA n=1 Tax=Isoptericola luteus TaxID=2879484 RepID=A0ABS7ZJH7_9MICO|nr:toxin HicA [Isoptericola sp. NEAU-Y5]MCA5895180.1 toxin HicA [Isoptericola sp. NEAU-Y5]